MFGENVKKKKKQILYVDAMLHFISDLFGVVQQNKSVVIDIKNGKCYENDQILNGKWAIAFRFK